MIAVDVEDLVQRHVAGESLNSLSKRLGVSRQTLGRRLEKAVGKHKPPPANDRAAALLKAHNDARAENQRPPLRLDPALQKAALAKAQSMAGTGLLTHAGFPARVHEAGYRGDAVAENLAAGQSTPKAVVAAWMSDMPHRANVLGPYQDLGAAGVRSAEGLWFWVADYGSPP